MMSIYPVLIYLSLVVIAESTLIPFKKLSEGENEQLQRTCGKMPTPLDQKHGMVRKVINGNTVKPGHASWVVRFDGAFYGFGSQCCGTLISPRHVLTSSHCTITPDWNNAGITEHITVRVGKNCTGSACVGSMKTFGVRTSIDIYNKPITRYTLDWTLLELDADVMNADASPACLWNGGFPKMEKAVFTAGWGRNNKTETTNLDWIKETVVEEREHVMLTRSDPGQATYYGNSGTGLMVVANGTVYFLGPLSGDNDKNHKGNGGGESSTTSQTLNIWTKSYEMNGIICYFTGICPPGVKPKDSYEEDKDYTVCNHEKPETCWQRPMEE